jgi:hypothetical protein
MESENAPRYVVSVDGIRCSETSEATDQAEALRLLQMAHYWISAAANEDWLNANSIHHPVRSPGSD